MSHQIHNGISIITACKDRNRNLSISIASWIPLREVREIIIVDWDSKIDVAETLAHLDCTKIKIIKVYNQPKWILSTALNLAAIFSSSTQILKLDCDNILSSDFFAHHCLVPNKFYTGNWKQSRNTNENHLNGVLYVARSDFFGVNGYNEYLTRYGWDDSDLYNRLEHNSLQRYDINNDKIQHIPHTDVDRQSQNTFQDIHYNRYQTDLLPWTCDNIFTSFSCSKGLYLAGKTHIEYIECYERIKHAVVPEDIAVKAQQKLNEYISYLDQQNNILYINLRNGLGNKLRALGSAITLWRWFNSTTPYNRLKWKLIIIWIPDEHCMAKFTDLYKIPCDNLIQVVNECPVITDKVVRLVDRNIIDEQQITQIEEINTIFLQVRQATLPTHLYLESASVINFPCSGWKTDCEEIQKLQVSTEIESEIFRIKDLIREHRNCITNCVGVHIRIGQMNSTYDNVDNWSQDKQDAWKKWRSCSNISTFAAQMTRLLQDNPATQFYLASDTESVYSEMNILFPGKIYNYTRTVWDRSVEQVVTGLIDIMLLKECDLFLGSNWSSYTELIRRLHNRGGKMLLAGVNF